MAKEFTTLELFDPETQKFGDLKLDDWIKQNKIREQARKTGSKDFPPTESAANDEFPSKIKAWVEGEATNCRTAVIHTLGALENSMKDKVDPVILEQQIGESELIDKETSLEMSKIESLRKTSLETSKKNLQESNRELEEFKTTNNLQRVADFSHRSNAILWILACAVIEIFLNAGLLMEVTESGLLGSVSIMVLIATINILTGACVMGPVLRRFNLINVSVRICWVVFFTLVLLAICAWNLFVGHFRDELWAMQEAIAQLPADASFQELLSVGSSGAIERFQQSPFGLDSFHSYLLVLVGMIFFAVAMYKGYQYDDPYPQYGKKTRANKMIEDYFHSKCQNTVLELEAVFESAKARLENSRSNISNKQRYYNSFRTSGERILESYKVKFNQYENVLQAALKAYCASNAEARSTPPPDWPPLTLHPELFVIPEFNPPEDVDLVQNLLKVKNHIDNLIIRYEKTCQDFAKGEWQVADSVENTDPAPK